MQQQERGTPNQHPDPADRGTLAEGQPADQKPANYSILWVFAVISVLAIAACIWFVATKV